MTAERIDTPETAGRGPMHAYADLCEAAHRRIGPHVLHTPLEPSPELSDRLGAEVLLKLENRQTTGSFKLRGVLNKILSLPAADLERPLVAASSGNHGAAFAHALEAFGLTGRLFASRAISDAKLDWLRTTGIRLELVGDDTVEAELAARSFAADRGLSLIHI